MTARSGSPELFIEGTRIAKDTACYLVAEIGHNHRGSLEDCKKLFQAAKSAGAHAVKLQKRDLPSLYTKAFGEQPYRSPHSYGASYAEHRRALELGIDDYRILQRFASELGLAFFATPFDIRSADQLAQLGVPAMKISSGDLRSLPLLEHVARFGIPILLSTGGATIEDVDRALETILPLNRDVAVLQCTSAYPTPDHELDLGVIGTYCRRYPETICGWSGHDPGADFAPVAYALGARIIEKHFTLDRTLPGSDHHFALEPAGFAAMSAMLERTRIALGAETKRFHESEKKALEKLGKKLVAGRDLPPGHQLSTDDVEMRSPGDGLWPTQIGALLGRTLTRFVATGESLSFDMFSEAGASKPG